MDFLYVSWKCPEARGNTACFQTGFVFFLDTSQSRSICSYSKSHGDQDGFKFLSVLAVAQIFARLINIFD